jgi:hypothetical protein
MSDTPTKRPAKKAAPKQRSRAKEDPGAPSDGGDDQPVTDEVFVIEPIIERYRYMFAGGRIMDVTSPYRADSTDRGKALIEAQRRWGGKKDDWRIEGVTRLTIEEPDAAEPSPTREGDR